MGDEWRVLGGKWIWVVSMGSGWWAAGCEQRVRVATDRQMGGKLVVDGKRLGV